MDVVPSAFGAIRKLSIVNRESLIVQIFLVFSHCDLVVMKRAIHRKESESQSYTEDNGDKIGESSALVTWAGGFRSPL
jgi:hypothetical protein